MNGDGWPDVIVGALNDRGGGSPPGSAFVYTSAAALGIVPSESVSPLTLRGAEAVLTPILPAGRSLALAGSGGTPADSWLEITDLSKSQLDPVTGSYTKTQLSRLLRDVARGREVVITRRSEPVARIVPVGRQRPVRELGRGRGLARMAKDFDAPLPDFGDYER